MFLASAISGIYAARFHGVTSASVTLHRTRGREEKWRVSAATNREKSEVGPFSEKVGREGTDCNAYVLLSVLLHGPISISISICVCVYFTKFNVCVCICMCTYVCV